MISSKAISERIANARKASGMTQSDLARRLSMTPQNVSKWERGESLPDAVTLKALADALNKDVGYFYCESELESNVNGANADRPRRKPRAALNECLGRWKKLDFSHAVMDNYDFKYARFEDCCFASADFNANKLPYTEFVRCDLTEADYSGCSFFRADLINCEIANACFDRAALDQSDFKDCRINNVKFEDTEFSSSCRGCSLTNVTFRNIDFKSAQFKKTTFEACKFINCTFSDCDLKSAAFTSCKADKISHAFLGVAGADTKNIDII